MDETGAMQAAKRIAKRLRASGREAWIAGGAVRDTLLGRTPHDVDVATSATPDEVVALWPQAQLVGAAFGVVRVPDGPETIEVATFRREGVYLDGRRPSEVSFGTLEDDARRRDFTVNGLYLDPETGEITDLVGGRRDVEERRLRAIGDPAARFREDYLRLLRAVRLAAQLDFEIEAGTRAALGALAPLAADVAAERTRDELARLLTGSNAPRGLRLLHETGLMRVILPEVEAMGGVEQPPQYHPEGDVWTHTMLLFEHFDGPSLELAFGALLHDVGKPPTLERSDGVIRFPAHAKIGAAMTDDICRRLRLSNESRERVVSLVANHMRFLDVTRMKTSTLKRFLREPHFEDHLALHRADCLASHGHLDNWEFVRKAREELGEEGLRPPRLVGGDDLMALGWPAGPTLGAELRRLEELQLEGKITSREEALEDARRRREQGRSGGGPDPPPRNG
ncbi:MAG: CCA tRNA nucleotidyltransferase [bacterium]